MTRSQSKGQGETKPEGPAETHEQLLPPEIQDFLHTYAADEDFRAFVSGESDALLRGMTEDWVVGTPDEVDVRLRAYTAEGIGHFLFWVMDVPNPAGLERFAQEITPRFR